MTLVKFKKQRLPWYDTMFTDLLGSDRLLTNDFFMENKWVPEMNIKENDKNFDIEIAAPGFSKKDFNISIENGVLHLSAEKKEEIEEEEDNYTRREFRFNSFERTLTLPETVNEDDNIDATYKHGILKLILNKLPEEVIKHKKIIEIS